MITYVRTATAMPGKIADLIAFAKELSAISKRVNKRELAVGLAIGGNGSEVSWIAQMDSLAQYEESMAKLMADSGYRAATKKVVPLLVPGSLRDHLWRHV